MKGLQDIIMKMVNVKGNYIFRHFSQMWSLLYQSTCISGGTSKYIYIDLVLFPNNLIGWNFIMFDKHDLVINNLY